MQLRITFSKFVTIQHNQHNIIDVANQLTLAVMFSLAKFIQWRYQLHYWNFSTLRSTLVAPEQEMLQPTVLNIMQKFKYS